MNNEPGLFFIFVIAIAFALQGHSGRYQLVQGNAQLIDNLLQAHMYRADASPTQTLFKIDTESGKTWEYIPATGFTKDYWLELSRVQPKEEGLFARIHDWITSQSNNTSQVPHWEPPKVGEVRKGKSGTYKFLGGDPSKKENWEKQ